MSAERRKILAAMCIALATVVSTVASLNVALPDLARDTGATPTQVQWIVDSYALLFAALLLFAGALGDRFGRRRVLLTGLGIFGSGALLALFVSSPEALIAIRAYMGIGAAAIMPATLSIITASFPPGERDQAVAAWAGVAGGSSLIGLLASGALLEISSWHAVFALNLVLATIAWVATIRTVPALDARATVALDSGGAALSAAALFAVVWAFIEAPARDWGDPAVVGAFVAAALLGAAFVGWELRREEPMLNPRLFTHRGMTAGTISVACQFFAMFGMIFVLMQYLQFVLGYSPLAAGAALAPIAVVMVAVTPRSPRLVARFGVRVVGPAGLGFLAGGLVLMSRMDAAAGYPQLLLAGLALAFGMGLATAPATSLIVDSLPEEKQGVASAVNDAAREVGGALGIAVVGSVLTSHVGTFGPAMNPDDFVAGFGAAVLAAAAAVGLGAIVAAVLVPGRSRGWDVGSDIAGAAGGGLRP